MTRTLKEEENVACARISHSPGAKEERPSVWVNLFLIARLVWGSAPGCCRRCVFALELCLVASLLYPSEDPHLWAFGIVRLLKKAQSPCRGVLITGHVRVCQCPHSRWCCAHRNWSWSKQVGIRVRLRCFENAFSRWACWTGNIPRLCGELEARCQESRCQEQVKLSVVILCGFYSKMDYLYVSPFNEGSQCLSVLQLNIEMCPKGWHSVNSECQTGCVGFLAPVLIYESVALKQRSYLFNKATQFPCGMPARCRQRFIVSILTGEENKKTPACCSGYCANTHTFPLPVPQTHTPSSVLLIHNWAVTSLCIWHTQFKERPILAAVSPRKGKYFNILMPEALPESLSKCSKKQLIQKAVQIRSAEQTRKPPKTYVNSL